MLVVTTASTCTQTESHNHDIMETTVDKPSAPVLHTCGTCNVSFSTVEAKRVHAKAPWHVYNVKRKMTSLIPISRETYENKVEPAEQARKRAERRREDGDISEDDDEEEDELEEDEYSEDSYEDEDHEEQGEVDEEPPDFDPSQCLFCNNTTTDLDANLAHMSHAHGLVIPEQDRLIVDLETLVQYLYLIITGYGECLACGSRRGSAQAARHHMMDKGHCRIDIATEASEFQDFYEESRDGNWDAKAAAAAAVQMNSLSLWLPSGKMLSHRTVPQPRHHRPLPTRAGLEAHPAGRLPSSKSRAFSPDKEGQGSAAATGSTETIELSKAQLTKKERKEIVFANHLADLSAADRAALMHLPAAEQRSMMTRQKRQVGKAQRTARRWEARMEFLNNKLLMEHFVQDAPGRLLG